MALESGRGETGVVEFLGGAAVAVVGAWVGSRLQARRVRRQWQTEMGAGAWRAFVQGLHAWRGELEAIQRMPANDRRRNAIVGRMKRRVWDMSPEVPSLIIFGPRDVDEVARALLRVASNITQDAEERRTIDDARVRQFDAQKWEFVVIASGAFGVP